MRCRFTGQVFKREKEKSYNQTEMKFDRKTSFYCKMIENRKIIVFLLLYPGNRSNPDGDGTGCIQT